jgi:hypothetical protein
MHTSVLALLLIGVPNLSTSKSAGSFKIERLADGVRHCFDAYLEQREMDSAGMVDPNAKPISRWAVKYCFSIAADKSSCRWSYEGPGEAKSFSSWPLPRGEELPERKGWTSYHWLGVSKDYNEDDFKGETQQCTLADSAAGGGWIYGTRTIWEQRLSLKVMVGFTPTKERMDKFPKT